MSASLQESKAVDQVANSKTKMPTLFISHGGGPCFFMEAQGDGDMFKPIDKHSAAADWYRTFPKKSNLPKPKAIVVISAHWESSEVRVTSQHQHSTLLYDYYGFPPHTYDLKYPCPGSPDLAKKICSLLNGASIPCVEDKKRNLDHGVFIPLKLMYPDADIPVVEMSILKNFDPKTHYSIGRALSSLRDEGVLIMASGQSTHDLRGITSEKQAHDFVNALNKVVTGSQGEAREKALMQWDQLPFARRTHGREEHLVPMFVAAGAASEDEAKKVGDFWTGAPLWMALTSWQFGPSQSQ